MEFDKSKVLTCVTADQVVVGQRGWFGETLGALEKRVEREPPEVLERVLLSGDRRYIFMTNTDSWSLFYPASEPTYAERQAQWVKANNVKVGTKVRFTKGFEEDADGSLCCEHRDAKGVEGCIDTIKKRWLSVSVPCGGWAVPFTALEVIKEPTYIEKFKAFVNENNIKEGTRIRITRDFGQDFNAYTYEHTGVAGKCGTVSDVGDGYINVCMEGEKGWAWTVPYYAMEVIKEPTYRPYNNDELNDLVGEVLTNKQSGRRKLVTGKPTEALGVNLDGKPFTAEILLQYYYRNKTEPCGIKEEV